MIIAGLDLSITSSGVIVMDVDDKTFEVNKVDRFGFTTKKSVGLCNNIVYYNKKDFKNDYERFQFFCDHIMNWCKDAEIVAIEDYAYGATGSQGLIFNLAEFEGNIKMSLYRAGKRLRFYPPTSNKKFFTLKGDAGKIRMRDHFDLYKGKKPDLSDLPIVESDKGVAPTSDIIDAFALCEFLRKELRLKHGIELLHEQDIKVIECFNNCSKEHPTGLISAEWDI